MTTAHSSEASATPTVDANAGSAAFANISERAIIRAVAAEFGVGLDAMLTRHLPSETRARHAAMFLIREELRMSYPAIGRVFRRDHTSVIAATRKIGRLVLTDQMLALRLKKVRSKLAGVARVTCCHACGQPLETVADRRAVVEGLKQQVHELVERIAGLEAATP